MKKVIYYLAWAATLANFDGNAAEVDTRAIDTIRILRAKNASLREYTEQQEMQMAIELSLASQEKEKEAASKRALSRENAALRQEQREAKELVDDVLRLVTSEVSTLPALPSAALPFGPSKDLMTTTPTGQISTLTPHQEEFLNDWNNGLGRIGPKAWEALGSSNAQLAQAMAHVIKERPNQHIEIDCLKLKSFSLLIDRKALRYIYKY